MRVSPDYTQVLCILIQKAAKRAREATRLDFTSSPYILIIFRPLQFVIIPFSLASLFNVLYVIR